MLVLAFGRMPTLRTFVLDKCAQGAEAYGLISQLKAALLPEESRKLELSTVTQQLEEALAARHALLQENANRPGATASTIVAALLKERSMLASATGKSSDSAGVSYGLEGDMPLPSVSASEAAILKSSEFRAICTALASIDVSTLDGAREALLSGFNGKCVVAVRTLCSTARMGDPIAKRHPTLGILNGLRSARIDYFNFSLRVNVTTQQVPFRMTKYHFATVHSTDLLDAFLRFDFDQMDWIAAPHGLQGYRQYSNGWIAPIVTDSRDYFCQPELMREFGKFGDRLFRALGCTVTSAIDGFTFDKLCDFFAEHLSMARRLVTLEEQYAWLQNAVNNFKAALIQIGTSLREKVYSADPASVVLTEVLLPRSAECIQACLLAEEQLEIGTDQRQNLAHVFTIPSSSQTPVSDSLPLLSQRAVKGKTQRPKEFSEPTKGPAKKAKAKAAVAPAAPAHYETESAAEPGSLVHSWTYTSDRKYLLISGRVWNVEALAKHLKVQRNAVCWPFLLAYGSHKNRPARCDQWGKPGHKTSDDSAHKIPGYPRGLDLAALTPKFSRLASAHDKEVAKVIKPVHARGKGKGKGRGGRGRGRGRAARGGDAAAAIPSEDDIFDWIPCGDTGGGCSYDDEQGNEVPTML